MQDVRKAVKEDGYRPFSYVMEMTHFLSALIANTTSMPRITWNDDAGEEMVFDGYLMTTISFRVMYQKLLSDTREILLNKVLLGLELPDLHHDHIHDELNNTEPGYSFISEKRNKFHNHRNFLITAMLEDSRHKDRFHNHLHTNELSGILWETAAIIEWMKICENCIENLFALAHYGSGQPARGTELATFVPENTTIQRRSVYSYRGFINLVAMYNKTQAKSQRPRVIGRSLPPEVGKLFVYWLALVIPTLDMIWTCLKTARTTQDPTRFRHHLFTGLTGNFNTDDFSAILASLSGERVVDRGMGRPMMIADTRHYLIALMRKHCRGIRDRNFIEEYFNEQSGHGGDAAENYAVTTSSILNVSDDHLDKFVEISKLQHRLLFPNTPHESLESGSNSEILPMAPAKIEDNLNKLSALIDTRISSILAPLASQVATLLAPGMKKNIVDAIASISPITPPSAAISAMPTRSDEHFPTAAGPTMVDVSQVDISPARFTELREIMGPDAVFKSIHQACAVELSARREKDLLVILGTGGGKSLIFMLCAARAEEVDLTTIVIVPLIALLKDLVSRLRKSKIRVIEWSRTTTIYGGQVTILSTEAAASQDFLAYFLKGCQLKKIGRVVLDEIHTLLTDKHYRPLLKCINQLRQGEVQFIGTSATIPESAVAKIMDMMHFIPGNTLIIRAPTIRKEIAYSVFEITSPSGYGPSDALYKAADGQSLELLNYIKKLLSDFQKNASERALIFCLSRKDAEEFAGALGCKFYHAGVSESDKKSVIDSWRDGPDNTLVTTMGAGDGQKALVATTALGAGIDHSEIKLVVHYKKPRNIVNFSQESGRAGRQLSIAHSIVFWDPKQKDQPLAPDQDDIGVAGITDYVSTSYCRRLCLGRHLDDDRTYKTCVQDGTVVLCDLCEKKVREAPVVSEY